MRRIKLDNGKSIELPSARVREFPLVYELAVRYLQAADEEQAVAVAREITDTWAQSLDPEELTLDDAWEILSAKAGPKASLLDALRDTMAEAMRDFITGGQGREMIREAITTTGNSGESV